MRKLIKIRLEEKRVNHTCRNFVTDSGNSGVCTTEQVNIENDRIESSSLQTGSFTVKP